MRRLDTHLHIGQLLVDAIPASVTSEHRNSSQIRMIKLVCKPTNTGSRAVSFWVLENSVLCHLLR